MNEFLNHFHFIRPLWFFAAVPALLLFFVLRARFGRNSNWEHNVDPELLPYLLETPQEKSDRTPFTLLLIAWLLATIAMAGPVWRKLPQPVHEREDALVIVFDLTRSMYAVDEKPNRLIAAKRKLTDLLDSRKEGVTGLIVFAGDAHVVSPLTDDARNIEEMVPSLAPEIMPAPGSRLTPALKRAYQLFRDGGISSGRILVMTDEIRDFAKATEQADEHRYSYPVSVLAVGTPQGAPINADHLTPNGGYLKDPGGDLVIPRVNMANLKSFANDAGGRFSQMTLTDADLKYLLANAPLPEKSEFRTLERDFDVWQEEGPWILLILLPLAALAFRRGWLFTLLPLMFIMHSQPAQASIWDDLWQTRDQQAAEALKQGDPKRAANLFKNPAWKGTASYRGRDYDQAAHQFADIDTADGKYNLGNALAHQGKFEDAIKAYDKALAMDPDNKDAAANKQLVEKLLQQKKQQQQKNKQNQQNRNGKNRDKNQQQGADNKNSDKDRNKAGQDQQKSPQDQGNPSQQQQSKEQQSQQQGQKKDDEKKAREQNAEQAKQEKDQEKKGKQQDVNPEEKPMTDEERQALQQWLRRVPDDPGGLLRRKFELQHKERMEEGKVAPDDSNSNW